VQEIPLTNPDPTPPTDPPITAAPLESNLLQIRRDPVVLDGVFLELTQSLYSNPEHGFRGTQAYTGDDDPNGLYIALVNSYTPADTDRRPAVFVDLGDLKYDDQKYQGLDMMSGYQPIGDIITQARGVTGTVTWRHIGTTAHQAKQYSCVTLDHLDAFSFAIRRDLCFDTFRVTGILKPKKIKEEPQEWEALVVVEFQFQDVFELRRETPVIRDLTTTMSP